MDRVIHIKEGLRIFKRSLRVRINRFKQYEGSADEICRGIINDCWNGKYFQTSIGHFCEFWTRDFSWCVTPLINIGYKDKVRKTLEYALNTFKHYNKVTTTISPKGISFDFPYYAPDSLASLIRSLRALDNKKLILKYKDFLNNEIKKFENVVTDKKTGLVKKEKFSSIKDLSIRQSSCYDNIMAAMLKDDLVKLRVLHNPLKKYNIKKKIKDEFWNGNYFFDDLRGEEYVAGDANVFPFYSGVFTSSKMLKKSIESIKKAKLDRPFPLKYTSGHPDHQWRVEEFFAPNYEGNTIWAHLGMIYLTLLKKVDKSSFEMHMQKYKELIQQNKNFLELYTPDGKVYKSPFYYADEGMLWSSIFLELYNEFEKK